MADIELRRRGQLDPNDYDTGLLSVIPDETDTAVEHKLLFEGFGSAVHAEVPLSVDAPARVLLVEYDTNNLPSSTENNLLARVADSVSFHNFASNYADIEVIYDDNSNIIPYAGWLESDADDPIRLNPFRQSDDRQIWRVSDNAFRIDFTQDRDTIKIYGLPLTLSR